MKDLNIIEGTFGEIYDATWRKKEKKRVNYYYKHYVDTNSQYFFVSHLTYYKNFTNKPFGCGPSAVPFSLHRPVYEQKPFCAISIWLESSRSIKLHPFIIRAFWMRSVCAAQTESAHFKLELNAAKHTHRVHKLLIHRRIREPFTIKLTKRAINASQMVAENKPRFCSRQCKDLKHNKCNGQIIPRLPSDSNGSSL